LNSVKAMADQQVAVALVLRKGVIE
jgi:hypothetical protein